MSATRRTKPTLVKARCETDLPPLIKKAAERLGLDPSAYIRSTLYQRSADILGLTNIAQSPLAL